jgi:UMP-CMP kinase
MESYHASDLARIIASILRDMFAKLFSKPVMFLTNQESKEPTHDSRHVVSNLINWGGQPPLIVFILGPPGAGKETHSKRLRRDFPGLTHLSYGDALRYHASIPGSWVSMFPRRGGGVDGDPVLPAPDAVRLLRETIESGVARGQRMWLIDGFPRTKEHMDAWNDAQMPRAGRTLFLECDSRVLVDRIRGRSATSGRPDDADVGKVRERVERNMKASDAMLQACRDCDVPVTKVDANRDLNVVYDDIRKQFEVSIHAVFVIHLERITQPSRKSRSYTNPFDL